MPFLQVFPPAQDLPAFPFGADQEAGKAKPPAFSLALLPEPSHIRHSQGQPGSDSSSPSGQSCPGPAGWGLRHLTPGASSSHHPILSHPTPALSPFLALQAGSCPDTGLMVQGCPGLGQLLKWTGWVETTLGSSPNNPTILILQIVLVRGS